MKNILFVVIVLNAIQAFAFEPNSVWVSNCEIGGKHFSLNFKSPSGDPLNDDMVVIFKSINGTLSELALPPALYGERSVEVNEGNLCTQKSGKFLFNIAAFHVENNAVIFLLSKSERPNPDTLVLVLVNAETGGIESAVTTDYAVLSNPNFKVRKSGKYLQVLVNDSASLQANQFWLNIFVKSGNIVLSKV